MLRVSREDGQTVSPFLAGSRPAFPPRDGHSHMVVRFRVAPALLFSALTLLSRPSTAARVCDARDYGAKGNGIALDTKAVQSAIDDCHAAGGGTVMVQGGDFLTGTLILKSNITLDIAKGASLLGTRDKSQYPEIKAKRQCFRCGEPLSLLFAEGAKNLAITGGGTVDGNDGGRGNPWEGGSGGRPRLVRFLDCDSLTIRNVSFVRSACWTTFLSGCRWVRIDSLTVNSNTDQANQDGIDIDDCKHLHMSNSVFTSGDDAVCFKSMRYGDSNEDILIENCTVFFTRWSAFKMGTESHGGMRNVVIRNCTVVQSNSGALCLFSVDGAIIDNVLFENIDIRKSGTPISLRLGARMRNYSGGPADPKPGSISRVTFRNIKAAGTSKPVGSFISGIPGQIIDGVTLENLDFAYQGGVMDRSIPEGTPPELENEYPQYDMFKQDMPAYGLYVRHARNLVFKNVKFSLAKPDIRSGIVFEKDVTAYALTAPVSVESAGGAAPIWHRKDGAGTVSIRRAPAQARERRQRPMPTAWYRDGAGTPRNLAGRKALPR